MATPAANRSEPLKLAAGFAIVLGVMTLISGGTALFSGNETRSLFGAVVPFVLWFNFLSGLAYIVTGLGLWGGRVWAAYLSVVIFLAIAGVFVLFAVHTFSGGAYEMRTLIALPFRAVCWLIISMIAWRSLRPRR